jgi:hypothetical protein
MWTQIFYFSYWTEELWDDHKLTLIDPLKENERYSSGTGTICKDRLVFQKICIILIYVLETFP